MLDTILKKSVVFIITLFAITNLLHGQQYAWPTNASKYITSTFCEFRPRHYHAALDIKTWRQSGYKIFAIEDGYVYRLRVSANGYGKALYLKLKDGNYAVYAHLSGFSQPLQAYSDSVRMANKRLILDNYPPPTKFPVKKGDFLGYTGETGIGVPHLHFEVRDAHQRPVNPWQYYRDQLIDNIAPRVRYLALIPRSASTFINFLPDTLIMPIPRQATVHISQPLYLTGKAYLALRTYDLADGASNQLDFYRAEMFVNDSLVYEVQYDRFSYEETRLIELDKNFSLWRKGLKIYHNFYRHPANSLPFYGDLPPGAGLLGGNVLREGENRVHIRVYDFAGNVCEITFPLIYHRIIPLKTYNLTRIKQRFMVGVKSPVPLLRFQVTTADNAGKPLTSVEVRHQEEILSAYYYHLTFPISARQEANTFRILPFYQDNVPTLPVFVTTDSLPASPPGEETLQFAFYGSTIGVKSRYTPPQFPDNPFADVPIYRFNADAYQAVIPAQIFDDIRHSNEFGENPLLRQIQQWQRIIPGRARTVSSPDGLVSVRFPVTALYDTIYARIRQYPPRFPIPPEYRYVSDIYDVQPFDQPLNYGAFLSVTFSDSLVGEKGIGVYYWDMKKGWLFLPMEHNPQQHRSVTRITSLEKFVLIRDTIPPQIEAINLAQFERTGGRNTPLVFSVHDEMAGIYKETQILVTIDGEWSLFEYDPEEDRVIIAPRFLPAGQHEVRITARDNAGNKATAVFPYIRK